MRHTAVFAFPTPPAVFFVEQALSRTGGSGGHHEKWFLGKYFENQAYVRFQGIVIHCILHCQADITPSAMLGKGSPLRYWIQVDIA
jgi:hypothetical protein